MATPICLKSGYSKAGLAASLDRFITEVKVVFVYDTNSLVWKHKSGFRTPGLGKILSGFSDRFLTVRISNINCSQINFFPASDIKLFDNEDEDYRAGRVNPKYLPQNFWTMTSSEVEDIFQKSVIFDMRKTTSTLLLPCDSFSRWRKLIY